MTLDTHIYYTPAHKSKDYLYIDKSGEIKQKKGEYSKGDPAPATLRALRDRAAKSFFDLIHLNDPKMMTKDDKKKLFWRTVQQINIVNSKIKKYNKKLTSGWLGWLFVLFKMDTLKTESKTLNRLAMISYQHEKQKVKVEEKAFQSFLPEEFDQI